MKEKDLVEGLIGHKDHSYQTAPNANAMTDQEHSPLDVQSNNAESVTDILPLRQNQCYVCHKVGIDNGGWGRLICVFIFHWTLLGYYTERMHTI